MIHSSVLIKDHFINNYVGELNSENMNFNLIHAK